MNLNLIALFSLGAFFSFLSYLVTTLEDKGINKENYKAVLLILFLKASLGGFICLILFHGLDYFFQNMNESLRVGIAGARGEKLLSPYPLPPGKSPGCGERGQISIFGVGSKAERIVDCGF